MTALEDAYDACVRLAQSHYENFPVASRLLPQRLRRHVAAIYAFARTADDFADEPGRSTEERLRLLAEWRAHLRRPDDAPKAFLALDDTIRRFDLPLQLFDDLVSAFAQDVTTTRYRAWTEVFDYCRRSANPVGRLVLRLSGYRDDRLDAASDALCTALQLTNFWQDLAVDWSRGRLYVPEETWAAHHADPLTLNSGAMTPQWRAALRDCGERTQRRFDEGRAVCDGVQGRLRYELRATWLGGSRILRHLERCDFDVFTSRPSLGPAEALVIACGTLLWRETRPSRTRS